MNTGHDNVLNRVKQLRDQYKVISDNTIFGVPELNHAYDEFVKKFRYDHIRSRRGGSK